MKRSAMMFANFGIIPKAIVLPNNMDPDEYIKAFGVDDLKTYFSQNEKNVYNWLFELSRRKYIKDDLESTEVFKKEVFEFIRFSKQNTIIEHFIRLLSEEININKVILTVDLQSQPFTLADLEAEDNLLAKEIEETGIELKVA